MDSPGGGAVPTDTMLVLQLKSLVTFKTNDEYLYAMKEDLAEWFMCLYQLDITVHNFFDILETGVILCEHANNVRNYANEQRKVGKLAIIQSNFVRKIEIPNYEVSYRKDVKPQTFQARDNLSNFITWTKNLGIPEVLTFETDDLVLRKNEKSVVLCLLEIARVGAKLGMLAPTLVQMEEEIDAEIESGEPPPQVITCDLKSLDEMVKWLAGRCTCPVQFPIIKVGEGKYKIGDSQTLVFVRILRKHVMIRVGGGWDTLEHYLDKHDPCRCGFSGHRQNQGGTPQKTPTRRASTPAVSHSVPTPSKAHRKLSMAASSSGGYSPHNNAQRPASPVRMRSMSPGPIPKSLPLQLPGQSSVTGTNKPPLSPLSPTGSINNNITGQRTYSVPSTPRRSQSPVPNSRLRSTSPVPSTRKSFVSQQRESLQSHIARPSSPVKRSSSPSPGRCFSPSPGRRCVSPSSSHGLKKNKIYATQRSKSTTSHLEGRHLSTRPSMDSSGNDSEGTDVTSGSGSGHPSVDMNQISTMTLDEFKNLLNSALSVPNGSTSEGSQESPRSQGSSDGYRKTSRLGVKKPPVSDKPSRYKFTNGNVSRSLDSKELLSEKSHPHSNAPNGYFEMDKPVTRKTIIASSYSQRPKTPVGTARPKTPTNSKAPTSKVVKTPTSVPRPKTPVSAARPKTPVSVGRPKTPVSIGQPKISTNTSRSTTPLGIRNKAPAAPVVTSQGAVMSNTHSSINSSDSVSSAINSRIYTPSSRNSYDTRSTYNQDSDINKNVVADKPNIAYVCIQADESKERESAHVSTDYSQSDSVRVTGNSDSAHKLDNFDSSLSNSESVTSRMHRSYTDPGANGTDFGNGSNNEKSECRYDSTGSSDSLIQSFNSLQKSIAELRNRAQQACIANDVIRKESAIKENKIPERTNISLQVSRASEPSIDATPHTTSILKRSQTDSDYNKVSEHSTNSNERRSSSVEKRSPTPVGRPSTPVGRPSTPVGRPSTPSLIPRPMTPVSKPQTKSESCIPQLSNQTPVEQPRTARPPTPKKATILAKAPSAARTNTKKDISYRSIYQKNRSTTPGPNDLRSMSLSEREDLPPRRSVTPGPGNKLNTYSQSQTSKSVNQSNSLTGRFNAEKENNIIERNRVRAASASPMVQRKTPTSTKTLTRQRSVEEDIVVTVNRSDGSHSISVREGDETKYKSERNPTRVLARAPTPTQRRTSTESGDSRGRSRNVPVSRPRPRSVDPERWNKDNEVVAVVNRTEDGHKINDRTEAWVESAVKTVASRTTFSSRKPVSILRRSKTPNPNDVYDHELQSRSLSEIKAALTLPVNGLKEVNPEELDAPPEDPEMFAKMEDLFEKMRERELKASVNETPGQTFIPDLDIEGIENEDDSSLDSNENIKRKNALSQRTSPSVSTWGRSSVPSTPPRSKTPSMSRSSSSSQPISRPESTPPRPSTPTRSSFSSSRRSSQKSSNESVSVPSTASSGVDHAVVLVSKIKEILNPKPRRDEKAGPKSRIPAPKSLALSGKSKSFSNLNASVNDWTVQTNNYSLDNANVNGSSYDGDCDDDMGDEISGFMARAATGSTNCTEDYRSQSGTKTPVPKLATPLTTGRKAVLNREQTDKSSKLVRAVSISSLSSSSNTMSCPTHDEEEFL